MQFQPRRVEPAAGQKGVARAGIAQRMGAQDQARVRHRARMAAQAASTSGVIFDRLLKQPNVTWPRPGPGSGPTAGPQGGGVKQT